ncbi:hypothetical protein [Chitinophaga sp.]|uniref:hypothetical protein n=1 Tax=Chitinophaga sp. TaxID=1869181 RepID=UPI0031D03EA2
MYMYYSFSPSTDINKTGIYPQAISDTKPFEWLLPPMNEQVRLDRFLTFEPDFEIILNHNAYLTDVVDRASLSFGLVVNQKVKDILTSFKLPDCRFYQIKVKQEDCLFDYYWFHFYTDLFNYLDYSETTFEIYRISDFKVMETFSISSREELQAKRKSLDFQRHIRLKKMILTAEFPSYDVMVDNVFSFSTFISKKLKDAFIESGVTGYDIKQYDLIHWRRF